MTFDSGHVVARARNGAVILRGTVQGGLYVTDGTLTATDSSLSLSDPPLWEVWHRRLGHVNYDSLRALAKGTAVAGLPELRGGSPRPFCAACAREDLQEAYAAESEDRSSAKG